MIVNTGEDILIHKIVSVLKMRTINVIMVEKAATVKKHMVRKSAIIIIKEAMMILITPINAHCR